MGQYATEIAGLKEFIHNELVEHGLISETEPTPDPTPEPVQGMAPDPTDSQPAETTGS